MRKVHLLNKVPPKQAPKPISSFPRRAKDILAIRSGILLPQANNVQPRNELLRFVVTPNTNRTLMISVAQE